MHNANGTNTPNGNSNATYANCLTILGDSSSTVNLDNGSTNWIKGGSVTEAITNGYDQNAVNATFDIWSNSSNSTTVSVLIEQGVHVI